MNTITTALLPAFTFAILLSATLLFLVQPMFAKMVLPLLGGTPAVWNTAMVFFQVTLLGGYTYAHVLSTKASPKTQRVLHIGLIAAALLVLPVAVAEGWSPPTDEPPTLWLLSLFAVSIGLPFFALSANAPLIQRWFSQSGHPHAQDPYFLYGASNVGSIAALLLYPFLIEPRIGLVGQGELWAVGYGALLVMVGGCGWLSFVAAPAISEDADKSARVPVDAAISWRRRGEWALYAFVPSSLLLGVTTYLATDVAAIPLVWIIPLVLYLLTFVNVFARRPLLRHSLAVKLQAFLIVPLVLFSLANHLISAAGVFALHLLVFFLCALVCHGELVRRRPPPSRLTEFYLWMSLGGALGGIFNALLAPWLFNSVHEYSLALVAACALRPVLVEGRKGRLINDLLLPLVLGAATFLMIWIALLLDPPDVVILSMAVAWMLVVTIVVFGFSIRPIRFAAGVSVVMLTTGYVESGDNNVVFRDRSFFGAHSVIKDEMAGTIQLNHGTTVHGVQPVDPEFDDVPVAYYASAGPVGQVFDMLRSRDVPVSAGLVGLGAGAVVCYKRPDEAWKVFEIDPHVLAIARDSRYFRYLSSCASGTEFLLGDARLSLEAERGAEFDLLLLDAFSSDSVPISLITREALQLYFDTLTDDGLLVAHVSNRYLDLESVFLAQAKDLGLAARAQLHDHEAGFDEAGKSVPVPWYLFKSHWIVLARSEAALEGLDERWRPLRGIPDLLPWTDDFSNVLQVFDRSPSDAEPEVRALE